MTVKELKIGQTKLKFNIEPIEEKTLKQRLIEFYDTINKIADNAEKRGVDTSSWFYTDSQLQIMKESNKYKFIQ